jgi:phenylalanyl-tRNA synthetase alpha chain
MSILNQLEELKTQALCELNTIDDNKKLDLWRVLYMGKKSKLNEVLRGLASLSIEEKKTVGATANQLKLDLETVLKEKEQSLGEKIVSSKGEIPLDISLPGRKPPVGGLHVMSQVIAEMCQIFVSMGFQAVEGPEVEWDYYNFDMLNIPKEHPARDNMQTLWVDYQNEKGERPMLLRTHTSPMQVRVMEKIKPPVRIVVPGKVYRYEAIDATHIPMFTQIEGLAVDKGITLADLKGTLYEFARRYYGSDRKARFRCDFFPFVEPGVEMAIECAVCKGSGCRLCSNSGWIEILGAGMVHPRVLEGVGIDSSVYTGFAFGMGLERVPMLRYGIDDIRLFYGGDLRFLRQF